MAPENPPSAQAPAAEAPARLAAARAPGVLLLLFVAGAVLMAVEIVGARIVAVSFGSTIYVWGGLIGIFMGSMSLGYYMGGRFADRHPTGRAMGLTALAAGLSVLVVPALGYGLSSLVAENLFPDVRLFSAILSPLAVMTLLFLVPAALIGALSPLAVRVLARRLETIGGVAGTVYGMGALGSIAGALIVVFGLMSILPNRTILLAAAALLAMAGTPLLPAGGRVRPSEAPDGGKG